MWKKGGITRAEARQLLHDQDGKGWNFEPVRNGTGKQGAWEVVSLSVKNNGNGNDGDSNDKIRGSEGSVVAGRMTIEPQRTVEKIPNKDVEFSRSQFVAEDKSINGADPLSQALSIFPGSKITETIVHGGDLSGDRSTTPLDRTQRRF